MPSEAIRKLRQKYPQYNDLPDQELARRILQRYPEYRDLLQDVAGEQEKRIVAPVRPLPTASAPEPGGVGNYLRRQAQYLVTPQTNETGQTFGSGFAKVFSEATLGGGVTPAMGAAVNAITSRVATKAIPAVRGLIRPSVGRTAVAETPTAARVATEVAPAVPPQAPVSAAQKVMDALKTAKPIRAAQERAYSAERSRRLGQALAVGARNPSEAGARGMLGALKGELPKMQFESIRPQLGQADIDGLFKQVIDSPQLSGFSKPQAVRALMKLIGPQGTSVPQESELDLLGRVFGEEFVKTVLSKRAAFTQALDVGTQIAGIPRALMATADVSAPFRQGLVAGAGYPRRFFQAFPDMYRAFGSERALEGIRQEISSRPTFSLMEEHGLALTGFAKSALVNREEQFLSNLLQRGAHKLGEALGKTPVIGPIAKLPRALIGGSDRAYSGFLTKLRADVFDDMLKQAERAGVEQTPKLLDDVARAVNAMTGRGTFATVPGVMSALSTSLFSPRLLASRLNMLNPFYYASLEPFVRKQALRSMLNLGAAGLTVIGLAKINGAEVQTDSRSADVLKPKFGNTRLDIWGGFQQIPRALSQFVNNKIISTTTGREIELGKGYRPLTRKNIAQRFFESKANPVIGAALDLMEGRDFAGRPVSISSVVKKSITPMVVQDLWELWQDDPASIPFVVLGAHGVGVQTYGPKKPR